MSHRLITFLALIVCLGTFASLCLAEEPHADVASQPLLTIYYIPFSAETFVGVTPTAIKNVEPLTITAPEVAAEVSDWLSVKAGNGQFHSNSTRLLVVFSDGQPDVLVDQFGYVLVGTLQYRLPRLEMARLDALLRPMLEAHQAAEEQKKEDVEPALIRAIHKDDFAAVKQLLEDKADPNIRGRDGTTALMDAADVGSVPLCEVLVNAGASVNAEAAEHETALSYAIVGRHLEVFQWLLTHGASVEGDKGATAFLDAVSTMSLDDGGKVQRVIVDALLKRDALVNAANNDAGMTPLMWAVGSRDIKLVEKIIRHGGNVNAVDDDQRTPLIWAAMTADDAAIRLLLAHGATLNWKLHDGTTALTMAVTNEHISTVRLLLSCGAICDNQTLTDAAFHRDHTILKLLRMYAGQKHPVPHHYIPVH